jgi:hypothetical protein
MTTIVQGRLGGLLILGLAVIGSCTVVADTNCPSGNACVAPARELYYKETVGIEPWAAAADGSLPAGWRESATADLHSAGLEPSRLEAVPIGPTGETRYALQVRVPDAQRPTASQRCFVTDVRDTSPPAAARADCQPFYTTKR